MSTEKSPKKYKAYCSECNIITEDKHSKQFVIKLVEFHNANRECDSAEVVNVCWVCGDKATHQNQKPPHEYTCDDHALSIDMIPLEDTE